MANLAKELIEKYGKGDIVRTKGGVGFKVGNLTEYHFSGNPVHYFDKEWKEIDTKLIYESGLGQYGTPWSRVKIKTDGSVKLLSKSKSATLQEHQTARIGIIKNGKFSELDKPKDARVEGDSLIRSFGSVQHKITLTERGVREQLILSELPKVKDGDLFAIEFLKVGSSDFIEHAPEIVSGDDPIPSTLTVIDGGTFYTFSAKLLQSLPLPIVIDPDYAGSTADGRITSAAAAYATSRATSSAYSTNTESTSVGYFGDVSTTAIFRRLYLLFDTSGIGDGDTITQVNAKFTYISTVTITETDSFYLVKQDWSAQNPLSDLNREIAFDNCLTSTLDGKWKTVTVGSLSANTQYTSDNLDTTRISKTGYTYYSLVAKNRDYDGNAWGGSNGNCFSLAMTDNSTAGYRPVLTVLSSAPSGNRTFRSLLGVGR